MYHAVVLLRPYGAAGRTRPRRHRQEDGVSNGKSDDDRPAPEADDEKQDKVLHTRISPSLDRQIKRRARNLGMSVSTVVRHVLLNTFDLVEDIVNDSAGVAASLAGDETDDAAAAKPNTRARTRGGAAADAGVIIAWQEAVLNLNVVCERCNAILPTGAKAAIAIRDTPGPRAIICTPCLGGLSANEREGASGERRP
jgi:hypothetical protein